VNNRGYTLIELSVVVLLIGMLLLIAVPRIRDTLLNDDLKAAARHLIAAARELRNESVREQTDYILHIDINQPSFWSYTSDTTTEKRAELRKKAVKFPEGIRILDVRQADEVKKTEGELLVRFFRKGFAMPTVVHLGKDDRVITLVIHPFIQAVTLYEKYVDISFNQEERQVIP
jgi:prepilin-type N-terminal cleavage/methylation domain-containing protein